jgi:AcrR family transcriptional regulator
MKVNTSRDARAESTRQSLIRHARKLFTAKAYPDVSTDEVVARAKLTKGALYHHYTNKQELYRAVVEEMERELVGQIDAAADKHVKPLDKLRAACDAYLEACLEPGVARVLVLEGPVVLGWKNWCNIAQQHEVAALSRRLKDVMQDGVANDEAIETTAQVVLGALNTAARVIGTAADPTAAREHAEQTIQRLIDGLGRR